MLQKLRSGEIKIAVIGLGYVGLPLAAAFGKKYDTIGFDVKKSRLNDLRRGSDSTLEISSEELKTAVNLFYTDSLKDLEDREIFIVTVPTPVDQYNRPNLAPLYSASETVGCVMKKGSVVIYESTVYPGCTEEECVPVLEKFSGLKFNQDFFCGYSPERINVGDKVHALTKIRKITSGSTHETAELVDMLYNSILENGTHKTSSIKVAEAAKVIENSQRDLNIAFVNELAKICHLVGIDTNEVLDAAATKWNFLPFKPGLVGGHCIGVDPYYLTHKAQALGYLPEVILAGRRINDSMGRYVASEVVKLMIKKECKILGTNVLQLGITFKENCSDIRNSKSADVVKNLQAFGCNVEICDPWADPEEVRQLYGLESFSDIRQAFAKQYSAVVLTVAHNEFMNFDIRSCCTEASVVYDVTGTLPQGTADARL